MSSDQNPAFTLRTATAYAALRSGVPSNRGKNAGKSWIGPVLVAIAAFAIASPASATRVGAAKASTHNAPAKHRPVHAAARKPKPAAHHAVVLHSRLQAANAGIEASLRQLHGRSGGQTLRAVHYRSPARPLAHHVAYRSGGISCVPYARSVTGMAVSGNAWQWWGSAAGIYERGFRPESGAVLNFRSTGHMQLGHVAVVARVISTREIEVDHANWAGAGVARGVAVLDVSQANDWSAVRVALGHGGTYGSVYPTYGFIYNRPDHGQMIANSLAHPPAAPRFEEVAEARPETRHKMATYSEGNSGR